MKHLRVAHTPEEIKRINEVNAKRKTRSSPVLSSKMKQGSAACLAKLGDDDELVDAALEAECDECRTAVGVAKKGDKVWEREGAIGVRETPKWDPQPMTDADKLTLEARLNRG